LLADERRLQRDVKRMAKFYASVNGPIFVGIDPGVGGAIAAVSGNNPREAIVVDMPCYREETKRKTRKGKAVVRSKYDLPGLFRLCRPMARESRQSHTQRTVVTLELQQPRPTDTALTGYMVGLGYAILWTYLMRAKIVHQTAAPTSWKREFQLLKTTKRESIRRAQALFPQTEGIRLVKDHNRAEALLLAEYGRRKFVRA